MTKDNRTLLVPLAGLSPGTKLMIHDELEGFTQITCLDCLHTWVVEHDEVLELPDDAPPVSRCSQCGDPERQMNISPQVGHA